jgi:hypothetical protein
VAGSAIGSNGSCSIPASLTEDWAGFVTLLDAPNGEASWMQKNELKPKQMKTTRIEGICKHPSKESEIYLIGSTTGQMDLAEFF